MDMHKVVTRELPSHNHCLIWNASDVMQAAKPPKTVDFCGNRFYSLCSFERFLVPIDRHPNENWIHSKVRGWACRPASAICVSAFTAALSIG